MLMVSRRVRGSRGVVRGLAVLAGCALLAGCGGSSAPAPRARASGEPLAERVCNGARQAAATALGSPLSARIVSPAAASLQCVLTGRQVQVTVGSQAGSRAYTEFDTETAHQEQVFGNGGVHAPSPDPRAPTVPGSVRAGLGPPPERPLPPPPPAPPPPRPAAATPAGNAPPPPIPRP